MLTPSNKRPTWLNGVIQIHITRACDLSCTGCTQGSNLAGKPVIMSIDNFEYAVSTLTDYYGVVGIFGGNPVLHPHFELITRIASMYIPKYRLGLWSNNLFGYGPLVRQFYNPEVSNLNVHCNYNAYTEIIRTWPESNPKGLKDSRHSPPYIALKDLPDVSDAEKRELIENCDVNRYWSAMICQVPSQNNELRAFFCELAGAQAMLHEEYPDTGLPVESGWWELPLRCWQDQIDFHCMRCGIPLKAAGDLAVNGKIEFVSKEHENIYKLKRPRGKELRLIRNKSDLTNFVNRATDYCENGLLNVKV